MLATRLIWYVTGLLEGLLGLRLLLIALLANPANPFARLVARLTEPLVAPFRTLLLHGGHFARAEASTVVAMVVILLLAAALTGLFDVLRPQASV